MTMTIPKRKSTLKCSENNDDIDAFLQAEKEAQEAYLQQPLKIDELPIADSQEKNNLVNVLNNQLINRQTQSEKKYKGIIDLNNL